MTIGNLVMTVVWLACLLTSAALLARLVRCDGPISYVLLAYVIGWVEVVAIGLLLSPFELVTTGGLVGATVAALAGSLLVWHLRDRPHAPAFGPAFAAFRTSLADPAIVVLTVVVAAGALYTLALGLFTTSLEWDALAYHLPRAALWLQEHQVGYIAHATDPRLDGNPPGAEIGIMTTMGVSGGDRLAVLPQLAALTALVLGVLGCGRRLGLSQRASLFGALIFSSLPIVAIQAPTTYNDLVVASFLVVVAHAALRSTRADLVAAALGLGLALTTKLTAIVALPVIGLIALSAAPRGRRPALIAALAVGLALGSPWYLVNLAETGHADGALTSTTGQDQPLSVAAIAPTIRRHLYSLIDISGSRGIPVGVFLVAIAVATLAVGIVWGIRRGTALRGLTTGALAALLVLVPLLAIGVGRLGLHAWYKLWLVLGRRDIAVADDSWQLQVTADAALSWFGPVAVVLLLVGTGVVLRDAIRRRIPRAAIAFALAPLLFIVVLGIIVPWDPWRGRFVVFAVALAAATWGVTLRVRPLAWAVTALAAVVLPVSLLALATKPAGVPLLEGTDGRAPSVWTTGEDDLLAYLAQGRDTVAAIVAARGAGSETVAVALRENDYLYPFFDHRQRRTIRLVEHAGGTVPPDARWLVVAPGGSVDRCGNWTTVLARAGWVVARRADSAAAPCAQLVTTGSSADPRPLPDP